MRTIILRTVGTFCVALLAVVCAQSGFCASDTKSSETKLNRMLDRAAAFSKKEQYAQAIIVLTEALETFPASNKARYRRGVMYWSDGRHKEAIGDFSLVLEADPQNKDARVLRGIEYINNKEYEKAIEDFDIVLVKDPQFKEAIEWKADAYEKLDKKDIAKSLKDESSK